MKKGDAGDVSAPPAPTDKLTRAGGISVPGPASRSASGDKDLPPLEVRRKRDADASVKLAGKPGDATVASGAASKQKTAEPVSGPASKSKDADAAGAASKSDADKARRKDKPTEEKAAAKDLGKSFYGFPVSAADSAKPQPKLPVLSVAARDAILASLAKIKLTAKDSVVKDAMNKAFEGHHDYKVQVVYVAIGQEFGKLALQGKAAEEFGRAHFSEHLDFVKAILGSAV